MVLRLRLWKFLCAELFTGLEREEGDVVLDASMLAFKPVGTTECGTCDDEIDAGSHGHSHSSFFKGVLAINSD